MAEEDTDSVAIVGMSAVFPGAPTLDRYWSNLRDGVDAISEVPPSRWDPIYYDVSASAPDRFYCRRGGFIDEHATFDALEFGIMPVAAQGAEPDQLLTLQVAARALTDAGYSAGLGAAVGARVAPDRTGVILGRGGYLSPGTARLNQYVRTAQQLVESLRTLLPDLTEQQLATVKGEFQNQLGEVRPDNAIGLVPNLAASRISNRLDLRGPAYTIDAACASSLVAVDHAVGELRGGRCDLMVAGGVHMCHDVTFWSVFTQLGALSRRQQIRPFHRSADGLLIGEGVGLLVLKRLRDAMRDSDRIYAVIRGTGVASDGRESSLMKPRVAGQVQSLRRAWDDARLDPSTVGLLEAHGTATPAGDEAELRTVAQVFGRDGGSAVIGSVKSMIGHTMPAAGAAGLIKAALALHHRVLPPTLHCDDPNPLLGETRFRTIAEAEDWGAPDSTLRAGVSAFGFGGINAHVVLEAHQPPRRRARRMMSATKERTVPGHPPVELLAAASPEQLVAMLDGKAESTGVGRCRLALFEPTPERRAKAREIVARGKAWRGRKEIYFSPDGLLSDGGKVCFVFPGIEAVFEPRVQDVAEHFELPAPDARGAGSLERHGTELVAVGRLLDTVLRRIGVMPDMIAGHSIGEWSGMLAAEMIPPEQFDPYLDSLQPGSLETPDVVFLAVGCGADRAESIVGGIAELSISHDNCPHQSILCGPESSIDAALGLMRTERVLCQKLPFRSGFHSPAFRPYLEGPRENVAVMPLQPPTTPLWSATRCAPYPDSADEVRELFIDHLTEPVRFRQTIANLHSEGVRAFVQVGTGSLVGFIEDTLRGQPHLAIASNVPKRTGLDQLRRVAAALWVEGSAVRLEQLPGEVIRPRGKVSKGKATRLRLGTELVRLPATAQLPRASTGGASLEPEALAGLSPVVAAELDATMREMVDAQRQIVQALRQSEQRAQRSPAREVTVRRSFSVASHPYLIDHCFYRQPAGWPSLPDRFPVVPMTMHLETMMEVARGLAPELVPVGIEKVSAYRWCAVEPSVTIDISAKYDGVDRVRVKVGDYSVGTVVMAGGYPAAPARSQRPFQEARPAAITAPQLYDDRWMFHGPQYQCVDRLDEIAVDGVRGELVDKAAPGSLLDNAGQLMGYWVMVSVEQDRLAFPIRIGRINFYGPPPSTGDRLDCKVWINHVDDVEVRTDMELVDAGGQVWCDIEQWVDRRFDTDDILWPMLRYPEDHLVAERQELGYYKCVPHWRAAASQELVARRFLDEREHGEYEGAGSRRKRGWLLGRIAVKDAVRDWMWRSGDGPRFPIEVAVRNEPTGRPVVSGPFTEDLRVSVAHKDDVAVALVANGRDVGIDIEKIEPRADSFVDIAFTSAEQALWSGSSAEATAHWQTRIWCAKEAAAKAVGTGLQGNPRRFEVREVAGDKMLVAGRDGSSRWVQTHRDGDYFVAWTID